MPSEDDTRPFPIQADHTPAGVRPLRQLPPSTIPWWLAEVAYEAYTWDQSLATIAARGGFGRLELVKLIRRET